MTILKRANQCPQFLRWLIRNIPAGSLVLDVGCGNKWYWPHIHAKFLGVDAWPIFEPEYLLDLEKDDLPDIKVDVVLFMDVIEHLSKARGYHILEQTMGIGETVHILTPTLWDSNEKALHDKECDYFGNPFVVHKSLWAPAEFEKPYGFVRTKEVFPDKYFHGTWTSV